MAHHKHWAVSTDDPTAGRKFRLACGMRAWINSAKDSGPPWSLCGASVYLDMAACDPDWYCVTCAKAARLALAAESAPKRTARCSITGCGSYAINPSDHGRTEGADLDLCDVCYWRKRAESATWPKPRPISDAPKDGSILGWVPATDELRAGWELLHYSVSATEWHDNAGDAHEPTHFLPLPPEVR